MCRRTHIIIMFCLLRDTRNNFQLHRRTTETSARPILAERLWTIERAQAVPMLARSWFIPFSFVIYCVYGGRMARARAHYRINHTQQWDKMVELHVPATMCAIEIGPEMSWPKAKQRFNWKIIFKIVRNNGSSDDCRLRIHWKCTYVCSFIRRSSIGPFDGIGQPIVCHILFAVERIAVEWEIIPSRSRSLTFSSIAWRPFNRSADVDARYPRWLGSEDERRDRKRNMLKDKTEMILICCQRLPVAWEHGGRIQFSFSHSSIFRYARLTGERGKRIQSKLRIK